MNKKIVAGALLGALSLGVGLNVIPEVNYQEGVKTKEVANVKRSAKSSLQFLKNEEIGQIHDFILSDAGFTSGNQGGLGFCSQKLVLKEGYYCVKGDVNYIDFSGWGSNQSGHNSLKVYFDSAKVVNKDTIPAKNVAEIEKRANELKCESFLGYLLMFYSDGVNPVEFRSSGLEDLTHVGSLVRWQLGAADLTAPSVTGSNNFVVNVNNMLTIDNILSHMSAYDDTDGKVNVTYDANGTTYNPNNKKTGKYVVKAYAQDRAGNRTNVDITVNVVDIDKPVISGTSSYTRSYDNPITLDAVKQALTISDNYDTNLQLQVVTDNYTGHERELGNKTITFKTVDSSNNESSVFTVTIKVEDKIPPVISGASEVKISSNSPISLETFKSKFTVSDALEGTLTLNVAGFENYLKDTRLSTTHVITLSAQDSSGNRVEKKVNLVVEDRIAPEIFLDNYFIVLQQGQTLTKEQLIEYASKSLGVSVDAIAEVSGEYDVSTPGTYKLSARLVTGETYEISLGVQEAPKEYKERAMKWYEYLYKWVTVLFNIEDGYYHTDSFFNFGTRCKKIGELYSTGIYKELIK